MPLVQFPPGDPVMVGRPFEGALFIEIDQLLEHGYCPDGWMDVEVADTRLTCLIHKSRPFLAGMVEPGRFSWVPLSDVVLRANRMEGAICSVYRSDPVRVLLMATHFRNRPDLQASTRFVDLIHVLDVLAADGNDAALALERNKKRTLMFLHKGLPARLYFGDEREDPQKGDITSRFLLFGFDPKSPEGRVDVFSRLAIEPDPDAGRSFAALVAEAKPPPPMTVLVYLNKRLELQRPFMPPFMIVGRDHTCEMILGGVSVSRQHAKLSWSRGRFMIEDLGSANGTTVNGKRIKRTILGAGDRIGLGIYEIEMVSQRDRDLKATMMLATDDMDMNLHLVGENQSVPLNQEVNIGKGLGVDLVARGPFVRQYHARIQVEGSGIHHLICPGHATVRLNGTKVKGAYLQEGDEIGVGRSKFRVVSIPAEKST